MNKRRTDFRKANTYTGQKIPGEVTISYKIDGVRMLYRKVNDDPLSKFNFVTRNNKTPPGFERFLTEMAKKKIQLFEDCEVYIHGQKFHDVSGPLNSHNPEFELITIDHIYPLESAFNGCDNRLFIRKVDNITKEQVNQHLVEALNQGYEGLVLRTKDKWYRVKPTYTADVYITGYFEQVDKNKKPKNILGGFTTNYGNVTAFKDQDRVELWENPSQYIGKMMTVKYKELYDNGSFRYAVTFQHFREDKDEESFDTRELPMI